MSTVYTSGMSLPSALFIVFLVLKLVGTITWSWWWVTAPLWIPFGIGIGLMIIGFGLAALFALIALVLDK